MIKKVGLIGVGLMGHGIARNILAAGWPLGILEHPGNQPVQDLVNDGARIFSLTKELAADSDVIIVCVTGSPEVEQVLCGENGVLEGIRPGTTVIDCSTAIPSSTEALAERVHKQGAHFLDAPMTRTPKEAEEGRLNLIVGGAPDVFEAHLPLLQSYAENIEFAGPVGTGHSLKLLHNMVSLGFSAVLAEAAACSARAGIDPQVFARVLAKGGGAGVVFERLQPYLLERDADSFRFSLSNAAKDTGYYLQMAKALAACDDIAGSVHATYQQQVDEQRGDSVVPELIDLLNR